MIQKRYFLLWRLWPQFVRFSTAAALLASLLLTGCVQGSATSVINPERQLAQPDHQLADYLITDCADIWQLSGSVVESNPLYWLRGMDCAARLLPSEARAAARQWSDDTWQAAFRRGILLSDARITPLERRRYMTILNASVSEVPAPVRALFEVWREGQNRELRLADERSRYAKLQQSADSELDHLRQQEQQLRGELEVTTRKLENLTDIERQLSSRKPRASDIQDSHSAADDKAPAAAAQEKPAP
ncbi:two-component system QseEF-associated lipoprotein QseG [Entomohabitans teleogrylli]|uniref:two-component system QseEF-associated lipoprotein QseG n=1 Tax=Entomohabitans teleogrylli TaxID=1384589 RepID=UPI00073DADBD|nr:two-component system QseEF-associated lipoprotein QseG [Entomohabitans teleogrylli]